MLEAIGEWIIKLYSAAPLSVRFAYTFWLLLGAQYIIIGYFEKIHDNRVEGKLHPKRTMRKVNMPWAVHIPLWLALILYNVGNAVEKQAPLCSGDADWLVKLLSVVGFLLLAYGLALATWGRLSLNGYWGPNCYEYESEQVIDDGAYRFLRHPIYSGQVAMATGTFLIALSWWGSPLLAVPVLAVTRAYREEGFMKRVYGDIYRRYRDSHVGFFPWRAR